MENSVCEDYITEKLWRPFYVGSVPIVYGSPKVSDVFPTNKSAIEIRHFANPKDLAEFVISLNKNDTEYNEYLQFKKPGGVTNSVLLDMMSNRSWGIDNDQVKGSYIDKLECLVCERLHENRDLAGAGKPIVRHQANKEHYGCPLEAVFNENGVLDAGEERQRENSFQFIYDLAWSLQEAFFEHFEPNEAWNFSAKELQDKGMQFLREKNSRQGQEMG